MGIAFPSEAHLERLDHFDPGAGGQRLVLRVPERLRSAPAERCPEHRAGAGVEGLQRGRVDLDLHLALGTQVLLAAQHRTPGRT